LFLDRSNNDDGAKLIEILQIAKTSSILLHVKFKGVRGVKGVKDITIKTEMLNVFHKVIGKKEKLVEAQNL
jgi:hypothetical protein